jgi:hypothetical protein
MDLIGPMINRFIKGYLYSPVIVVGCHRSGTSFLVDKLRGLGVFMGNDLNDHSESIFFLECNQVLLNHTGSNWYAPFSFLSFIDSHPLALEQLRKLIIPFLKWRIFFRYMGVLFFMKTWKRHLSSGTPLWGWKDPRNSITLRVWLSIFPEAKIIHVSRNGMDVAKSIQTRELNRGRKSEYRSEECKDFSYCYKLWECYEASATKQLMNIESSRILHVSFNRLISDPAIDAEIKQFIA